MKKFVYDYSNLRRGIHHKPEPVTMQGDEMAIEVAITKTNDLVIMRKDEFQKLMQFAKLRIIKK